MRIHNFKNRTTILFAVVGLIYLLYVFWSFDSFCWVQSENIKENYKTNSRWCKNTAQNSYLGQRGKYWVLYNYVKPTRTFDCDESITYTTPADMTFLNNLIPLLERWQGPVSVALYSPAEDLNATLERIHYLRECTTPLVKALTSFHLFFDEEFTPNISRNYIQGHPQALQPNVDCSKVPKFGDDTASFRKNKNLHYPINVARNIAREMATTHYILAADIELFPSPGLIPKFLEMVSRKERQFRGLQRKVFVLPHFEVEANVTRLPDDKTELVAMLKNDTAVPFHHFSCSKCHSIPKIEKWKEMKMTSSLNVFHVAKRMNAQKYWEPFYIGTKLEPIFDERLTWEGRGNKMTQNYIMCLLDYKYLVLDNAFLVHSPGIKRTFVAPKSSPVIRKQYSMIAKKIVPEIHRLYGTKKGCKVLA